MENGGSVPPFAVKAPRQVAGSPIVDALNKAALAAASS